MAHRNSDMYSMKKSFPVTPRHTAATPAPADIAESAGFLSYWLRAAEPVPEHKKTVLRVCASMTESAEPAEQLLRPPPHFLWHRNASPGKVKSPRETTGNTHGPQENLLSLLNSFFGHHRIFSGTGTPVQGR